jgi:hypothetical protein
MLVIVFLGIVSLVNPLLLDNDSHCFVSSEEDKGRQQVIGTAKEKGRTRKEIARCEWPIRTSCSVFKEGSRYSICLSVGEDIQ